MRVPTIRLVTWFNAGWHVCDELTTNMDLLPAFVGLGGGEMPNDRLADGRNIEILLYGQPNAHLPYQVFFYYRR